MMPTGEPLMHLTETIVKDSVVDSSLTLKMIVQDKRCEGSTLLLVKELDDSFELTSQLTGNVYSFSKIYSRIKYESKTHEFIVEKRCVNICSTKEDALQKYGLL